MNERSIYNLLKNIQDCREHFMVGSLISDNIWLFYEWCSIRIYLKKQDCREHFMVGSLVSDNIGIFYDWGSIWIYKINKIIMGGLRNNNKKKIWRRVCHIVGSPRLDNNTINLTAVYLEN
jgi:hypothetical protein